MVTRQAATAFLSLMLLGACTGAGLSLMTPTGTPVATPHVWQASDALSYGPEEAGVILWYVAGAPSGSPVTPTPVPTPEPTPTPTPEPTPIPIPTPVWRWPFQAIRAITSPFGEPRAGGYHHGVDMVPAGPWDILAIREGCVVEVGWYDGYGNRVVIQHPDGYASLYAHMASFSVSEGDCVARGQPLGLMDSTGNSTGPHLHLEIKLDGVLQDPLLVLPPIGGDQLGPAEGGTDTGITDDWGWP